MQLHANKTAKYFIHDEFYRVEIQDEVLRVCSRDTDERIPFVVWDGSIQVRRGIVWGQLEFFSHVRDGMRYSWLVQGLPWPQCRQFAEEAMAVYCRWQQRQRSRLSTALPHWKQQLVQLQSAPHFLSHTQLNQWCDRVRSDLQVLEMELEDVVQQFPEAMETVALWYLNPSACLSERNEQWTESERERWAALFATFESSPLNVSQQSAVLLNDNYNLVLAGAGSGKTSVLSARVAYLMESGLAQASQILLLSFGRDAADEMQQRLKTRIGTVSSPVTVNTFHQLGLAIIRDVEGQEAQLSPIAGETKQKEAWAMDWLKKHWMTPTNFKRWQKHLSQWPIAYIKGDDELGSHAEDPKLILWLTKQVEQLSLMGQSKKQIQQKIVDQDDYARLNGELALCWPCYLAWCQMLKDSGQLDFNLMISKATDYVRRNRFKSNWTFIMVDEYQDISPPRLALLEALCQQQKSARNLFAVGDDWQSIYQFTGSDVDLTTRFEQRFPESSVAYLDTTYRFNNKIGEVANAFVQANPHQLTKPLNSVKTQEKNAVFIIPQQRIEKKLDQLDRGAKANKSVLILGRNHYHQPDLLEEWQKQYPHLTIQFMTCHASKGQEADYVIIVGVDEGQFPAKYKVMHLDSALTLSDESFPYAEERRLFYVAMTRARECVWVTYSSGGSSFIKELLNGTYAVSKR